MSSFRNRHLFHLVDRSAWPFISANSAFLFLSGLCFYMHRIQFGGHFFLLGLTSLILSIFFWLGDIILEGTSKGDHSLVVRQSLSKGFLLFIVSEFMLFVGFFWAFFHTSLCPSFVIGGQWPPVGIVIIPVLQFPLYNTTILLISGLSITWIHRAFSIASYIEATNSFIITGFLGLLFVILQSMEYYESIFNISDSIYASGFFMLTGLHGLHVVAGASFIIICFVRFFLQHFMVLHYLGFVFALWYWHFVDAIWILLFFCVYVWGSW